MALAALCTLPLLASCDRAEPRGEVRNPRHAIGRDGAASIVLGGKVLWAFGDTFTAHGGVRSSAAYATLARPTDVDEPLVDGVPHQFVPFTPAERADDAAATDGSTWVIWPSEMVATSSTSALVFSTKFRATPHGWTDGSLVVSEVRAGSTASVRKAEPIAGTGRNYAAGIYERNGTVYLHDCGGVNVAPELSERLGATLPILASAPLPNPTDGRCRLAKVPTAKATDPAAYRYWNGAAWLADPLLAVGVVPGSQSGMSVAWSPKRKRYVALSTPGYSPEIRMSTAPRPEGPWSEPRTIYTAETDIYAVRVHPHLSSPDLATMGVTYFRQDTPTKPGGVVLVDLTPAP